MIEVDTLRSVQLGSVPGCTDNSDSATALRSNDVKLANITVRVHKHRNCFTSEQDNKNLHKPDHNRSRRHHSHKGLDVRA